MNFNKCNPVLPMKKIVILIIVIVALAGFSWYFRVDVENFIVRSFDKLFEIKESAVDPFVSQLEQIEKEISVPAPLRSQINAASSNLTRSGVIEWTNGERIKNNLSPLDENLELNQAAAAKAQDMFKNQYFEHVSPSGIGPGQLAETVGYNFITLGENLALGNYKDDQALVQAWMNSPEHRANILNSHFRQIGVAVVKGVFEGKTTWLAVQEFGTSLSSCPPQPDETIRAQISANENRLAQLSDAMGIDRQQINNLSKRDSNYNQLVAEYNNLVNQYNLLAGETKTMVEQYNVQVRAFNTCVQNF